MSNPDTKVFETLVISNLSPRVENGKYPVKRVAGEIIHIEADIFKDGHDRIAANLLWRKTPGGMWRKTSMTSMGNDRWTGGTLLEEEGSYEFMIRAWPDDFETWLHDFTKRLAGDQSDLSIETEEGRIILNKAALRAASGRSRGDAEEIEELGTSLMKAAAAEIPELFAKPEVRALLRRWPDTSLATESHESIPLVVEPLSACFSAWYEFFPRGALGKADQHSTFRDCLPRIEAAKEMGFDVVYFPPIHPIGTSHRKGKNNSVVCEDDDVGSPWAIGNRTGGHRSVEPALGDIDDFVWLVDQAHKRGMKIALDFAINCSPDHPYVEEHPEWFFQRPDGTIKYAENPPKKYQDIYPLNFHCEEWRELWDEMLDLVLFWIQKGVHIFRVDNPHTKPIAFWEWLIAEVNRSAPGTIFLAEAFTRPKMMRMLAKIGFAQSYTYFTWRETKEELTEYITELTRGGMQDYYRANFWPNTPDILPRHLQNAPPAAFKIRAALAATLSTSWGIYSGYELCENEALPGREEYLDSEKYQLKERDWNQKGNIKGFISRLNHIRTAEAALRQYRNIEFIPTDNDQIISYFKWSEDPRNVIIVAVNLDPENLQQSQIYLPLEKLGIAHDSEFQVNDLLFGETYTWRESTNFVALDPRTKPVHILRLIENRKP